MQETPPHTPMEIKLLLSQYLDGALDLEQVHQVETLLSTFPQYADVLNKLQATRDVVRASLGNQEQSLTGDTDSLWASIASRLEADQEAITQAFDLDFVSAYYDGEIPTADVQLVAFERQLYKNDEANAQLAQISEVSEAMRQWAARLETYCTVDVTDSVMTQLQSEMVSGPVDADEAMPAEDLGSREILSAYVDEELSPREVIEANRLIESDEVAKLTLTRFNQISAAMESISAQIQAQAPDLAPAIMETLSQSSSEGSAVVSLDAARRSSRPNVYQWAKWGGLTAASVLLVTFLSSVNWKDNTTEATMALKSAPIEATTLQERQAIESPVTSAQLDKLEATELASVPASSRLERPANGLSLRAESIETGAVASMRSVKASPRRPERILDGFRSNRVAARTFPRPDIAPEESRATAPSSEDYLFNALNEQMPGEDVSSILGK